MSSSRLELRDFWTATGRQLRRPDGRVGRLVGHLMSLMNWRPYLLAIARLDVRPDNAVLELGFGSGRSLKRLLKLATAGSVAAIDHSDVMVEMARRKNQAAIRSSKLQIHQGGFAPLSFRDHTFERILLVNVAYFFDKAGHDMRECFRVLKPEGRIVVYVTQRSTMAKWPFCEEETHRTFDQIDAVKLLTDAGFQPRHIQVECVDLPFAIKGLVLTAMK